MSPARAFFIKLGSIALAALVIATLARVFVAEPFVVSGPSMLPTFGPGDYLVIDRLTYALKAPARGDVIVFRYPLDASAYFVKRIVGLPGETIEVGDGAVWLVSPDGSKKQLLDGPYNSAGKRHDRSSSITLADDEYFMLGDNRDVSDDSREWGPLRRRYVIGRVVARLLPLSQFGLFPGAFSFGGVK